jgi:hypothetical protein
MIAVLPLRVAERNPRYPRFRDVDYLTGGANYSVGRLHRYFSFAT